MMGDYAIGLRNLIADANWMVAPLPLRLMVLACSKREDTIHMGYRIRIGWLWGVPYLLKISEER